MMLSRDADLAAANTLALPCRAAALLRLADEAALAGLAAQLDQLGLPAVVLGEGSNVVLPPRLDAAVVRLETRGIELLDSNGDHVTVRVAGGEHWHDVVAGLLARDWFGLENLALIPGSAGAAPVQNIGAYGVELCQFLVAVEVLELATGKRSQLAGSACEFTYRDSIFKHRARGHYLITALHLSLSREPRVNASYGVLADWLAAQGIVHPLPRDIFHAVIAIRRQRLPDPARLPNAGSFFKNPVVSAAVAADLRQRFPGIVCYPQADGSVKLAAGWLVEKAGWRGRDLGAVGTHSEQSLVVVNRGGARQEDVLVLEQRIRADVAAMFGLELVREPALFNPDGSYAD